MKTFIPNKSNFKVMTPEGFCDFAGVAIMGYEPITEITLSNGFALRCSEHHKVYDIDYNQIAVKDLKLGVILDVNDEFGSKVISINRTDEIEPVYDLVDVKNLSHIYYTNGILSSNCEFVSGDNTLINGLALNNLKHQDEIFKIDECRWYEEPIPNHVYGIALDPAIGAGNGDFAAIQVYDLGTMNQVAEWRSTSLQIPNQIELLLKILYYIYQTMENNSEQIGEPEIYWTVENNSLGEAALIVIEDTGEENFPGYFVHEPRNGRRRKGLTTTSKNKMNACSRLKSLIESRRMNIRSKPLIRELKNFVQGNGSFHAKPGEHDDLVSATLLVIRILQIISHWDPELNTKLNDAVEMDAMEIQPLPFII
jgi:hypothetical protein